MQNSLQAYLEGKTPPLEFAIVYHIGNPFNGETEFRLRGDGSYELWSTVTKERQRLTYSGRLSVSQVEQVVQELLATGVWTAKHIIDKPMLDEPAASIAIECDRNIYQVVLWTSEIKEIRSFAHAQRVLLTLVHNISLGEILENGQ